VAWLVIAAAVAACGRFGFDAQSATRPDGAPGDGAAGGDGGGGAVDGSLADDGAVLDATLACGYIDCGPTGVTCCDASTPACTPSTQSCLTTRRFECDADTGAGCTIPGEMCCLTIDAMGTECVNPLTEPCYG